MEMKKLLQISLLLSMISSAPSSGIFTDDAPLRDHAKYSSYLNLMDDGKFLYNFHPDYFQKFTSASSERISSLMVLYPAEVNLLVNPPENFGHKTFLSYLGYLLQEFNLDSSTIDENQRKFFYQKVKNAFGIFLYHYWRLLHVQKREISENDFKKNLQWCYDLTAQNIRSVIKNQEIQETICKWMKQTILEIPFSHLNNIYIKYKSVFISTIRDQFLEVEFVPLIIVSILPKLESVIYKRDPSEYSKRSMLLANANIRRNYLPMILLHLTYQWRFNADRPNGLWFDQIVDLSMNFATNIMQIDIASQNKVIENFLEEAYKLLHDHLLEKKEEFSVTYSIKREKIELFESNESILKEKFKKFLELELNKSVDESIFETQQEHPKKVSQTEESQKKVLVCNTSIRHTFLTLMVDALLPSDELQFKVAHCAPNTLELNVYFTYSSVIWQIANSIIYLLPVDSKNELLSDDEFVSRFFNNIFDYLAENIGTGLFSLFSNVYISKNKNNVPQFLLKADLLSKGLRTSLRASMDFFHANKEEPTASMCPPISRDFFLLSLLLLKDFNQKRNPLCFSNNMASQILITSLFLWPLPKSLQKELAEAHSKFIKNERQGPMYKKEISLLREIVELDLRENYWWLDMDKVEPKTSRAETLDTFLPAFMCPVETNDRSLDHLI
jgi:hypothetical protein